MQVGFVGLGNMGSGMALNAINAGLDVAIYDIRASATTELVGAGASLASSLPELAAGCGTIHVCVLTESQVRDVIFGASTEGLVAGTRSGCVVALHSTLTPQACRSIADEASQYDLHIVDAPTSGGGSAAARMGTLSLIVGGDDQDVAACADVFSAMSSTVFHVGPVGSGQSVKLINNAMAIVNGLVIAETLQMANQSGLNESVVLDVVNSSTGGSYMTRHLGELREMARVATDGPRGMTEMAFKDLFLALSHARSLGVSLPLTGLASQLIEGLFEVETEDQ
jgi:3-hydroxyisobutyrate dehydrogenase